MITSATISIILTGLIVTYVVGYQWGKYARVIKDLGTAA